MLKAIKNFLKKLYPSKQAEVETTPEPNPFEERMLRIENYFKKAC
jgi:hypothetical protein